MSSFEQSPFRQQKELEQTFINQAESRNISNQYESNERNITNEEILDEIESSIKSIQKKLIAIRERKQLIREDTEQLDELEEERRQLKRELIDLDYQHKQICSKIKKDNQKNSRRKWEDVEKDLESKEIESLRKRQQDDLQIQKRLREQLHQIEQSSIKRREEIQNLYKQSIKQQEPDSIDDQQNNKHSSQKNEKIQQDKSQTSHKNVNYPGKDVDIQGKTYDDRLYQAKYKARIAQIQLELASESLRRSREIELESEIVGLRTLDSLYCEQPLLYRPELYPYSLYHAPLYPAYPYI